MSTEVIPDILIQEIYSGNKFTGVVPAIDPVSGSEVDESLYRGRIQKWLGCTAGGLFVAPANIGMRVEQVWWDLDCTDPNVDIYLVDDDDIEYLIDSSATTASGMYVQTNGGILVPPSFSLSVKSSVNIDAVVTISSEDTSVPGDGSTVSYSLAFANGRVDKGTVSIVAGSVTFTDPSSDGVLVGAGGSGGSGVVNYYAGTATITLVDPTDFNSVNALADYDYNKIGRVGITIGTGWVQTTFGGAPILGKSVLPPAAQGS